MKRILVSALGLAVASAPQLAMAKLTCYPLTQIERALDAEYGEMRRFSGREATGIEYRLYVNGKTGSWSWIGIPAGTGVGCLIFAGNADEDMPGIDPPAPTSPPQAQF
jgi:hypothetical protein